jgi:hypothetical protein
MATITYGKGKSLQPTSLKALEAALDENAQSGRIEMPDATTNDFARLTALGFVRVASNPTKVRHLRYMLAVSPGSVATKVRFKKANYRAAKDDVAGEREEVRVTIFAPDLAQFFSSKKKKSYSY